MTRPSPAQQPQPNTTCPLCGGANDCAPATAGSFQVDCWCRTTSISPEALARIPAERVNKACLCPRCAAGLFQLKIKRLDHRDQATSTAIHRLLVEAHAQEKALLGVDASIPFERTREDIQSSDDAYLGAFVADTLSGAICIGTDDEPGQTAIKYLIVGSEHQRKRIGSALVAQAIRLANGAVMSVATAEQNHPALALYRKQGFEPYRRGTLGAARLAMLKLRRAGDGK
jgi:ribosomal protein S18 acetylase RimI-like enzyme